MKQIRYIKENIDFKVLIDLRSTAEVKFVITDDHTNDKL